MTGSFARILSVVTLICWMPAAFGLASDDPALKVINLPRHERIELVQKVLDAKGLQMFYHEKSPGRMPVVLSADYIGQDLLLKKFGEVVTIKPAGEKLRGAYLRFRTFDCQGTDACQMNIELKIEGVGGYIEAMKVNGLWKITKEEFLEH